MAGLSGAAVATKNKLCGNKSADKRVKEEVAKVERVDGSNKYFVYSASLLNFEKLIVEPGKIISCVFLVIAAVLAVRGMPLVSDTDRFYRPPGETERVSGKWWTALTFNEVSLDTGQTINIQAQAGGNTTSMTGLSFSPAGSQCFWFLTEHGPGSLNSQLVPSETVGRSAWCWQGSYVNAKITNTGAPQVVRYQIVPNGNNAKAVTLASGCDVCGDMPTFSEVSDYDAIRMRGFSSLGVSAALGFLGWVAWIGIPNAMGYLYVIGRSVMPSPRAKAVRQEFERAKTTGKTFDTRKTYSYDKPAENAFRRQQDIDDMDNLTASFKRETERLRAMEARMRASKQTNQEEYARLVREYEKAVERVKELQIKAARAAQGEA